MQRWDVVNWDLQQVGELVGVSAGPTIDPGQPVLFNAPTYSQLPYQVQRPMPTRTPRSMVPAIDQAVAQVNAFVVGFNPFLPYYPQVPALQTQARSLRLSLIQLRQEVTGTASPRQQQARLNEINQLLEALNASWTADCGSVPADQRAGSERSQPVDARCESGLLVRLRAELNSCRSAAAGPPSI